MQIKRLGVRTVIVYATLLTGIVIGSFGSGIALGLDKDPTPVPEFPINEQGQTYGSALNVTSLGAEPDLIKAYGVDGTLGYVRSEDLRGVKPKNPSEAVALTKQLNAKGSRHIPLYDVDGKTVIGQFSIGDGKVTEERIKE
ncbi:hypothetical protein BAG01nite_47110 [Brevibacillus agri]|uniref:Peptidase M56 BlaR1 n=2 Tax=Brevibacillus agri TaxID=51101 RepID=A0A3M8AF56_9BACL|nr:MULTISPECIES: hypothetical protein [Brevibacillus]ELK39541.1 peptidase M56 BlaR1 [Brevibacillus agri BAB-2500]EJL45347.1 hypothetical protein PMI08_01791 [Brevibacillus sp. CF112]MBG9566480.1 peptidase M56 BlaR1 [Brevibacillus agri]MBY0053625.1 peptidase M56 BlaR1 [Brevibacillus agri]MCG5254222.1 peptidase M56 BlaR1 [Brevibacillus agri]